jgi:hypothetical protein
MRKKASFRRAHISGAIAGAESCPVGKRCDVLTA